MRNRRGIILKAFLVSCPPEKRASLASHLSPSERESLSSLPDIEIKEEVSPAHLTESIHWSWFLPVLKSYPEKEQKLFLRAFNPSSQKALSKALGITQTNEKIRPLTITFLRETLHLEIQKEDLLPTNHLPPSPLNLLLQMEKKKLTELIDLLSLFDLSAEIRQIVETKILKKIYSFLSKEEKAFLQSIAGHKEPYPPAQIRLDQWDGTKESLRVTLHKIGLARLGSALSGQDPDLIWYICHKLDSGRGGKLEKLCKKEANPAVAIWLAEQLKELL